MSFLAALMGTVWLHAMFVTTEYALVRALNTDVQPESVATDQKAKDDIFIYIEHYLIVCQIGKTITLMLTGLCLGFVLHLRVVTINEEFLVGSLFLFGLGFLCVVVIQLVIGFELPKRFAINNTETCVDRFSGFVKTSSNLLYPLVWLVKKLTCY